jgi:hypothetical protein
MRGELSASSRIGESAGFDFWYEGGMIPVGRLRRVWVIAACTSWAAASMLRSSVNWRLIATRPWLLDDVITSSPAMVENCFSSGVATAEAMVSGLAPGRLALTEMTG